MRISQSTRWTTVLLDALQSDASRTEPGAGRGGRPLRGHLPAPRQAPGRRRGHRTPRRPPVAGQARSRSHRLCRGHARSPVGRGARRVRVPCRRRGLGAAVPPRLAGAGLHAPGPGRRHGGVPRAGAAALHQRRQRAQREELLQRAPGQVRDADRPAGGRRGEPRRARSSPSPSDARRPGRAANEHRAAAPGAGSPATAAATVPRWRACPTRPGAGSRRRCRNAPASRRARVARTSGCRTAASGARSSHAADRGGAPLLATGAIEHRPIERRHGRRAAAKRRPSRRTPPAPRPGRRLRAGHRRRCRAAGCWPCREARQAPAGAARPRSCRRREAAAGRPARARRAAAIASRWSRRVSRPLASTSRTTQRASSSFGAAFEPASGDFPHRPSQRR